MNSYATRIIAALTICASLVGGLIAWKHCVRMTSLVARTAPPPARVIDHLERMQRAHYARTGQFADDPVSLDAHLPVLGTVHLGDASLLHFSGCDTATIILEYRGGTYFHSLTLPRDLFLRSPSSRLDDGCTISPLRRPT